MSNKLILAVLALMIAAAGIGGLAYARLSKPDPVAEVSYECTTCDARQAAKKRLREHLQSLPD